MPKKPAKKTTKAKAVEGVVVQQIVTIEDQLAHTPDKKDQVLVMKNKFGYDTQDMRTIINTVAKGASIPELQLFLYQAKKLGLDPLTNQIHFVKYGTGDKAKITIQTGIDGFRAKAQRSKLYAGSDDYVFDDNKTQFQMLEDGKNKPRTATVTVYKIIGGQRVAFTATAEWNAYFPKNEKNQFMWNKMPFLMLGKCAEALALRKAFPDDLSGVFIYEEMEQATFTETIDNGNKPRGKGKNKEIAPPEPVDYVKKLNDKLASIKLEVEGEQPEKISLEKRLTFYVPNAVIPTEQAEAQKVYNQLLSALPSNYATFN